MGINVFSYASNAGMFDSDDKASEHESAGSLAYNEQRWRIRRNEKMMAETIEIEKDAESAVFERHQLVISNDTRPASLLTFHQFDSILAIAGIP